MARVGRQTGKGRKRWYLFIKTTLFCVYVQEGGRTAPSPPQLRQSKVLLGGRGREKTNKILNSEIGKRETEGREAGWRASCCVWWHRLGILSTHEAKADNYKFKVPLATGSSKPT